MRMNERKLNFGKEAQNTKSSKLDNPHGIIFCLDNFKIMKMQHGFVTIDDKNFASKKVFNV